MAKLFMFERLVMFSAPGDTGLTPGSNATWCSLASITPLARQFRFTHTGDELIPFGFVRLRLSVVSISYRPACLLIRLRWG